VILLNFEEFVLFCVYDIVSGDTIFDFSGNRSACHRRSRVSHARSWFDSKNGLSCNVYELGGKLVLKTF